MAKSPLEERLMERRGSMPDEMSPPVKPNSGGSIAARGIKTGPPIDQNSKTLPSFAPVAPEKLPEAAPHETHPISGDATFHVPPGTQPTIEQQPPQAGGNSEPTMAVTTSQTSPVARASDATMVAGPQDVTLAARPDGVTLIAPPFQGSLGSSSPDATLNSTPHDATLGGGDGATAAFHQAALEAAPKPITKGASFGHYELLEPIAKGGMGIVYKARQRNLNRIVAIKMILAGQFADQDDINRFYAEAEAAAALSHPNIVAIHEIGEVSGQHFFSMDFIEGKSLSGLIQENPVSPRRAAELMITISETMQFAHESGVVHRDLKPANVLLDKRERPLITDFGLAKQVSNTSQLTMAGSIVGTPSYMPPEQAAGKIDEVGPWSDLYSLGAILYELLTGRPPFRAASPFETIRQVLETEPPSPRLLNPNVPRDLETICLKCLQKERVRRYDSAQELADELKRFLRGEPIKARPISQVARFWRLCKRYPVTSSAIGAAALLLIAASIISTAAYFLTSAALKQEAISNQDLQEAVDKFLTRVGEQKLANLPGGQVIQKELLDDALIYNEKFLKQRGKDPRVANEVARSFFRVGKISMTLGRYEDALTPLLTAREMQERLLTKQPNDEKRLKALGDTLTELGQIRIRRKKYDEAAIDYAEAARIRGRLAAAVPDNIEYQRLHANAHMNAAIAAFNLAQIDPGDSRFESRMSEAREAFERAQTIRLAAIEHDQENLKLRRDLAKGYYNMGDLARVDNRVSEAIDNFKKADAVFEELLSANASDLDNQRDAGVCRRLVGDLLVTSGKIADARQWFEQALDHLELLAKQNPDVAEYQNQQAGFFLTLFDLEKREGNNPAARSALERARKIYTTLTSEFPDVPVYQRDLSLTLRELAKEKHMIGEHDAASSDLQEAVRLLSELVQQYPDEVDYAADLKETQAVKLSGPPNSN